MDFAHTEQTPEPHQFEQGQAQPASGQGWPRRLAAVGTRAAVIGVIALAFHRQQLADPLAVAIGGAGLLHGLRRR